MDNEKLTIDWSAPYLNKYFLNFDRQMAEIKGFGILKIAFIIPQRSSDGKWTQNSQTLSYVRSLGSLHTSGGPNFW